MAIEGAYRAAEGDSVLWHFPAHKVRAVDTTGAGDCFHGAYAFALTEGKSPVACALYADGRRRDLGDGAAGRADGAAGASRRCLAKMAEAGLRPRLPIAELSNMETGRGN